MGTGRRECVIGGSSDECCEVRARPCEQLNKYVGWGAYDMYGYPLFWTKGLFLEIYKVDADMLAFCKQDYA